MGLLEITFSVLMFGVTWFAIFKLKLIYDNKKPLKNIEQKIEKQNKKFVIDGKPIDLIKELKLKTKEVDKNAR